MVLFEKELKRSVDAYGANQEFRFSSQISLSTKATVVFSSTF